MHPALSLVPCGNHLEYLIIFVESHIFILCLSLKIIHSLYKTFHICIIWHQYKCILLKRRPINRSIAYQWNFWIVWCTFFIELGNIKQIPFPKYVQSSATTRSAVLPIYLPFHWIVKVKPIHWKTTTFE